MEKLENYLSKLNDKVLIFGLEKILKGFHKNYGRLVFLDLKDKVHKTTYYYWISGKSPIPIKYLKMFSKYNPKILDMAYEDMKYVSVGRKKCILPKTMTNELAYLLGTLNGDGYVHKNGGHITLATDSKKHIEIVGSLFKKLFNVSNYTRNYNTFHKIEIGSRPVHSFISLFCPVGRKTGHLKVPSEVKNKNETLIHYLSGLFDTDGCIGYDKKKIQAYFVFVQLDKNFTFEVYKCLLKLGLHVNEPRIFYSPKRLGDSDRSLKEWRIYIGSKKDLYDLLSLIKFYHPIKKKKAEFIKNKMLKKWAQAESNRQSQPS